MIPLPGTGLRPLIRSTFRRILGEPTPSAPGESALPLQGYPPTTIDTSTLDRLTDAQLTELNSIIKWNCFTTDGRGRRVGDKAKAGKRDAPQLIPDPRILRLHQAVDLSGKSVLELGCFEGVHTIGLAQFAESVTGVDIRVENVVKTLIRCGLYGVKARVFLSNVDTLPLDSSLPESDVVFHCGVLYHLVDPVGHLQQLLPRVKKAILLDTHYAREAEATANYQVGGVNYAYKHYGEHGLKNVFAGAYDHAKWLPLETLKSLLHTAGLTQWHAVEPRDERNGPRVLIIASR